MDDKIRTALDQMPEKNRSKLEPHADVIRELRRKGRTYEEIANFFSERFDLKVAASTIHAFVRVRARRHQRLRIELPPPNLLGTVSIGSDRPTTEDVSGVQKKIEALKQRPLMECRRNQSLSTTKINLFNWFERTKLHNDSGEWRASQWLE